jgi:xanthine dehydrogenase accessory factor
MHDWLSHLQALRDSATPAVLVTLAVTRGSVPREAGCKMVVTRDSLFGTIGGGNLEFACIDAARELLDHDGAPLLRDFPLGPALGQCCGGHVSVLFEPILPAARTLALFGAGHVGRALVQVLRDLPLNVLWYDSRPDAFPPPSRQVRQVVTADPVAQVAQLPPGAMVLVMTHDHQVDFAITAAALRREDLGFVGLIGSATKRVRFLRRLVQAGLDEAAIARVTCPIGLPGIGGKHPAEIAVSVAAQLLQHSAPAAPRQPAAACEGCAAPCSAMEQAAAPRGAMAQA